MTVIQARYSPNTAEMYLQPHTASTGATNMLPMSSGRGDMPILQGLHRAVQEKDATGALEHDLYTMHLRLLASTAGTRHQLVGVHAIVASDVTKVGVESPIDVHQPLCWHTVSVLAAHAANTMQAFLRHC